MVVHRIEKEGDAIGVGVAVTRGETTADSRGLPIEKPCADIQRAIVVEDSDLGLLGGRLTFVGILLCEAGDGVGL